MRLTPSLDSMNLWSTKSCFCVPMLSAGCRFPAAGLEQVSIAAATAKRALWKEGSLVFNVSLLGGDAADHGIEVPHTGAHDHGNHEEHYKENPNVSDASP